MRPSNVALKHVKDIWTVTELVLSIKVDQQLCCVTCHIITYIIHFGGVQYARVELSGRPLTWEESAANGTFDVTRGGCGGSTKKL